MENTYGNDLFVRAALRMFADKGNDSDDESYVDESGEDDTDEDMNQDDEDEGMDLDTSSEDDLDGNFEGTDGEDKDVASSSNGEQDGWQQEGLTGDVWIVGVGGERGPERGEVGGGSGKSVEGVGKVCASSVVVKCYLICIG
jgi:hypothetical protein